MINSFMQTAIEQAAYSNENGGIPEGAALIQNDVLLAVGQNKMVQENNPIMHAIINCLQNAGQTDFKTATIYTTLMPCYLCAGALLQLGIKKIIVGESFTTMGAKDIMVGHGIEIIDLDLPELRIMMRNFIQQNPHVWEEYMGKEK